MTSIKSLTDFRLSLSNTFPSKELLLAAIEDYCVPVNAVNIQKKNTKSNCIVRSCSDCSFYIRAIIPKGGRLWKVIIAREHTCLGELSSSGNVLSPKMIARDADLQKRVTFRPKITPKDLISEVKISKDQDVKYWTAYRALNRAKEHLFGPLDSNFQLLPAYKAELLRSNPDSILHFETCPQTSRFQRLFLSFNSTLHSIRFCRPLITLDGIHLTGDFGGKLLAACTVDALGRIYPIAFGICEIENGREWRFFLEHLHALLRTQLVTSNWTSLSDRQKGLIDDVSYIIPNQYHGNCVKHLADNVAKRLRKKALLIKVWETARALTVAEYQSHWEEIRIISSKASDYLAKIGPDHWVSAYFPGDRYGYLTSNISEFLNSWLLTVRELPLLSIMDELRRKIGISIQERRDESKRSDGGSMGIVKLVHEQLKVNVSKGRNLTALVCGDEGQESIEVRDFEKVFVVDLKDGTCTCGETKYCGYPCCHLVAACVLKKKSPLEYTSCYCKMESLVNTYTIGLRPMRGRDDWEIDDGMETVLPPAYIKRVGRRRKKQFRRQSRKTAKRQRLDEEELDAILKGEFNLL
ncbi:hypothetical protein P9112_009559 [Eukaryota sp. TZLM1-RC]